MRIIGEKNPVLLLFPNLEYRCLHHNQVLGGMVHQILELVPPQKIQKNADVLNLLLSIHRRFAYYAQELSSESDLFASSRDSRQSINCSSREILEITYQCFHTCSISRQMTSGDWGPINSTSGDSLMSAKSGILGVAYSPPPKRVPP